MLQITDNTTMPKKGAKGTRAKQAQKKKYVQEYRVCNNNPCVQAHHSPEWTMNILT